MKIHCNMGDWDRGGRIALGIFLLALVPTGVVSIAVGWGWPAITVVTAGFFAVVSGFIGYCPLYDSLEIDTCRRKTGGKKGGVHPGRP